MKTATRLLLLIIDSDSARAEQVAASLRLNGTAVHMDRFDSAGEIPSPCAQYDLCLISLEHRETLKDVGIQLLRDLTQDCPILALGQPKCECTLGSVLAHGFADWVDVDDLLHLREVAKREGDRLASQRHTSLLRNALLDSERRAEQVMQDAREPHAIIIDGAHASTNRSYLKLLGLESHEQAVATPFLDLIDDTDRDKAKALLRGYARSESSTRQARLSLKRADDLVLDTTLTLSPYVGDGERGLLLTVRSLAQLPPPSRPADPLKLPNKQEQTQKQAQTRAVLDKAMRQNALKLSFLSLENSAELSKQHVLVQLKPRDAKLKLPCDLKLVRLGAEAGTAQSLDRWLLFSAAREAQRLSFENTQLHVPISARTLSDGALLGWLRQLLGQIANSRISLCLSLHIDDCRERQADCAKFIEAVQALGCTFGLCDAFKGSDDLALLKSLKPDFVQLHPAVINSFNNQSFSAKNLQRLVSLIHCAGGEVICPPMEHPADSRKLAALGIRLCPVRTEKSNPQTI